MQPAARSPRWATSPLELVQALALLVVLVLVLLWKPATTGRYYAPTDLLQQSSELLRVAPASYRPENPLLGDPVFQMHPWLDWNRNQLSRGDLPVWNPYNGSGTPHLANPVTAVLSPFSLPFYMLDFRVALVVAAALKLLVLGLFTYLFVRRIGLTHLAGLVASVAFTFSAYHLLWLNWPHPGSVLVLPAGLWCAEVALRATSPARARAAWAGYASAAAVSILAGHPEIVFFAWGALLAYVPLRLLLGGEALAQRRVHLVRFGAASLLGLTLTAVQVLPFAEYLQASTAYAQGAGRAGPHYNPRLAVLHAFPDLFGSPSQAYHDPDHLAGSLSPPRGHAPSSNYNEAVSFYIGLTPLLLAGLGLISVVRRPSFPLAFLAASAGIWLLYAYDVGGINRLFGTLPLVELNAVNRSHPLWTFAISCLAGAGLDLLASPGRLRRPRAVGVIALGLGGLGVALVVAEVARRDAVVPGSRAASSLARAQVSGHLRFVAVTFAVSLVAMALLALAGPRRRRALRAVAGVSLVGAVFAQGGWLLRDHNPTISRRYFYPQTPALAAVKAAVGEDRLLLPEGLLPPEVNLWYRVHVPETYDGMGVHRYDRLYGRLLGITGPGWVPRLLDVTATRWVVTAEGYPFARAVASDRTSATLDPVRPVVVDLSLAGARLDALTVRASPAGPGRDGAGSCDLRVTIEEEVTGRLLGGAVTSCRQPMTAVDLAPLPPAAEGRYRALLTGTGHVTGVTAWDRDVEGFRQAEGAGEVLVFERPAAPRRYHSPAGARPVGSDAEALELLTDPSFDPVRTLLVHRERNRALRGSEGSAGSVEVIEETATEVRLRVRRDSPGWVAALISWYPGWEATVDGRRVEVSRADMSSMAVPVPGGASEVVLRYHPASVRWGAWVSAGSVAAGLACLGLPMVVSRARSRRSLPSRV